jgi:hypothetical protein
VVELAGVVGHRLGRVQAGSRPGDGIGNGVGDRAEVAGVLSHDASVARTGALVTCRSRGRAPRSARPARTEPTQGLRRPIVVTIRRAPALAGLSWVLAGCGAIALGEAQGVDPTPHAEVTAPDSAVRLVAGDQADLVLYVSNQSFDDAEVRLSITVDDVTVVEGDFHVEGQHNWIRFPLALSPGQHHLTAASDSGATLRESFRVPRGATRYAVIDHWVEDGAPDLTWRFSREPVAFA